MSLSEEIVTNRDSVRVTARSRAWHRWSLWDASVGFDGNQVNVACPKVGRQIEWARSHTEGSGSMWKRIQWLMIIKLGKYNKAEELLIETRATGFQGCVCYWNGDQRVSVTRASVHMEGKGTGMRTGYRGEYNRSLSREWEQVCIWALWSNQRSISTQ